MGGDEDAQLIAMFTRLGSQGVDAVNGVGCRKIRVLLLRNENLEL